MCHAPPPRHSAWRWRQQSTLAFGGKSLVNVPCRLILVTVIITILVVTCGTPLSMAAQRGLVFLDLCCWQVPCPALPFFNNYSFTVRKGGSLLLVFCKIIFLGFVGSPAVVETRL